jgi:hypothetical protein
MRSILTEIYLCHACSYHEIEDGNARAGGGGGGISSTAPAYLPSQQLHNRGQQLLPLECAVEPGDMIYVPSWWWHLVETIPEEEEEEEEEEEVSAQAAAGRRGDGPEVHGRSWSAAMNFWFRPYYTKGFGCSACALRREPGVSILEAVHFG